MKLIRKISALTLAVLMISTLTGCPGLVNSLNVAAGAVNGIAIILKVANPQASAIATETSKGLGELSKLVAQYDAADAASKPGIANEIRNVLDVITQNSSDILAAVRVKNPALLAEIQVGIAIANVVIGQILDHLPKKTGLMAVRAVAIHRSLTQELPPIKAKSAQELKTLWNQAVSAQHPEAVIR